MSYEAAGVVKLKEGALRVGLGVSKVTLWSWRKKGMPVLSEGRRGVENVYDAVAVLNWLEQHAERDGTARGYAILGRLGPLAKQLGLRAASSAPAPVAAVASTPASPVVASGAVDELAGRVVGIALANSLIPWCGLICYRHGVDAERALDLFEDFILFFMAAAAAALSTDDFRVLFSAELEETLTGEGRVRLFERIRAMREEIETEPDEWAVRWSAAVDKWEIQA